MKPHYVPYYRVSTQKQNISGLGLSAQRQMIEQFIASHGGEAIAEFTEIETGKRADRPRLMEAIALCIRMKAVLLIANLSRLARNLHFVTTLQQTGVQFVAVDNPHATPFVIHILCAVAEQEAVAISSRTKLALEQARKRLEGTGRRLGNPNPQEAVKLAVAANRERARAYAERLAPIIKQIQKAHVTTLRGIAECLNARGFTTPNGKAFAPQSVKNLLERMEHPQYLARTRSSLECPIICAQTAQV